jgi:hypothetical protein
MTRPLMPQPSMSQVGVQQLVPLLMVKSMDASLQFYIDGLGFTMTNKWTLQSPLREPDRHTGGDRARRLISRCAALYLPPAPS